MKKFVFVAVFYFIFLILNSCYSQPTKIQFENGFTLVYSEKKNLGLVSINLFVKGGAFTESDEVSGITSITCAVLTKGTSNRDSDRIASESESLGASISAGCLDDFLEVSMIVLSENFMSAFDIFADVVNAPTFPADEFEKEKIKTIAAIKSKTDHIFSVGYDLFNEQIFTNHPYHRPVIGYEITVSSLTVEQVVDTHKKLFKPENMVLCVVGDIEFEKAKSVVQKYFGNIWIDTGIREKLSSSSKIRDNSYKKIVEGKFKQSYIFTGFLAPDVTSKEYAVVKVISTILGGGMGSRLFEALREKSGLVYEASSFYPTRKEPSAFVLYAGTSKENIETVESVLADELKKLAEITDDELKNAKEYLKGTYQLDHRTIQRQAWWLGFWEILGKGYEYDKKYLDDIDKVTIADIKTTCEKIFNAKKEVTIILK
ncbi:MAG: pitrilysin family protein [Elusimicrobiota bacterium]